MEISFATPTSIRYFCVRRFTGVIGFEGGLRVARVLLPGYARVSASAPPLRAYAIGLRTPGVMPRGSGAGPPWTVAKEHYLLDAAVPHPNVKRFRISPKLAIE